MTVLPRQSNGAIKRDRSGTGLIVRTVAIVLFFRPPATAECRFQAKPFRHDACPSVAAIRLASLQATADRGQLRVVLGLIHETSPRGGPGQRPIAEYLTRLRRTVDPLPMAASSPVLGAANQAGTQRVTFDIANDLVEMFVILDRKRLVPSLI